MHGERGGGGRTRHGEGLGHTVAYRPPPGGEGVTFYKRPAIHYFPGGRPLEKNSHLWQLLHEQNNNCPAPGGSLSQPRAYHPGGGPLPATPNAFVRQKSLREGSGPKTSHSLRRNRSPTPRRREGVGHCLSDRMGQGNAAPPLDEAQPRLRHPEVPSLHRPKIAPDVPTPILNAWRRGIALPILSRSHTGTFHSTSCTRLAYPWLDSS